MQELIKTLCERLEQNIPVVLATIIHQQGSTPRGAGTKMLVDKHGIASGTVGGGLAEAEALKVCAKALEDNKAQVMKFNLTGEMAADCEMICGGLLQIFVDPIMPNAENLAFFKKLLDNLQVSEPCVLTILKDNKLQRRLCIDGLWEKGPWEDESLQLTTASKNELLAKLSPQQEIAHITDANNCEYIIEKYPPQWQMIIAGGGHVSLYTAQLAAFSGFSVIVMDDRAEFSNPSRFPQALATYTVPDYINCFAACPPTKHTCLVIVTRGHLHDKTVLEQALKTKASYIGMIGSKRKRKQVYDTLLEAGASQEQIDKVYCPIGLGINAETPEEIAVSILAQCIAHRRAAWDILQR